MEERGLKRAFLNGWVLTLVSLIFIVVFAFFVFVTNEPNPEVRWDMGGKPFVPASAAEADGYFAPVPGRGLEAARAAAVRTAPTAPATAPADREEEVP